MGRYTLVHTDLTDQSGCEFEVAVQRAGHLNRADDLVARDCHLDAQLGSWSFGKRHGCCT